MLYEKRVAELSQGSISLDIAGEHGIEGVTGGGHTVFLTHVVPEVPCSSQVFAILQQPLQFGCGALQVRLGASVDMEVPARLLRAAMPARPSCWRSSRSN